MSWRDHLLEWLCALGVAIGTLVALHQIESRATPASVAPAPADPTPEVPALGSIPVVPSSGSARTDGHE